MVKRGDADWPRARRLASRMIAYVYEASGMEWLSLREAIPYIAEACKIEHMNRRRSDVTVECFERLKAMEFEIPAGYIPPWMRDERAAVLWPSRKASDNHLYAFYDTWDWRTLRYEVLLERGRKCECCGSTEKIVVDHIKPLRHNWHLRLEKTNLQVLCDLCNMGKGHWDTTDFRTLPLYRSDT
mgnify:CR=1 FL=1